MVSLASADGLVQVHPKRVVVATGGTEVHPVFPGNDLPGVMLGRAAAGLLTRGVKPGSAGGGRGRSRRGDRAPGGAPVGRRAHRGGGRARFARGPRPRRPQDVRGGGSAAGRGEGARPVRGAPRCRGRDPRHRMRRVRALDGALAAGRPPPHVRGGGAGRGGRRRRGRGVADGGGRGRIRLPVRGRLRRRSGARVGRGLSLLGAPEALHHRDHGSLPGSDVRSPPGGVRGGAGRRRERRRPDHGAAAGAADAAGDPRRSRPRGDREADLAARPARRGRSADGVVGFVAPAVRLRRPGGGVPGRPGARVR